MILKYPEWPWGGGRGRGARRAVVAVDGLGGYFNRGITIGISSCVVDRNAVLNLMNGGKTNGAALFHLVLSLLGTSSNRIRVSRVGMSGDRR